MSETMVGGRVRFIGCDRCGKERHAPRVPEAYLGWEPKGAGVWHCNECCDEPAPEPVAGHHGPRKYELRGRRYSADTPLGHPSACICTDCGQDWLKANLERGEGA